MTLLYFDEFFTQHETGRHPENAGRITAIGQEFARRQLFAACQRPAWEPASNEDQLRAHTADYARRLAAFATSGGGMIEQDTYLSPRSYDVSQSAAGAAIDATRRVLAGEASNAFCVIRPPGHHALIGAAMGFCLLNNVAIAARYATDVLGLDRVLVIDWDVHHGNGTQAIFWDDPRVGFYSIHRWPFYPGTGAATETGAGEGVGTTLNEPIEYGTSVEEYHRRFERGLEQIASRIKPQLILISAGFDAHRTDPIGSLDLESEDFQRLTTTVLECADQYADSHVVSLLEGGYNPRALAESAALHLETLLKGKA